MNPSFESPAVSLACDGLPVGIGKLAAGRCYALVTGSEDESSRLTLATLAQAMASGYRACWLADALPERSLARIGRKTLSDNPEHKAEILSWNGTTSFRVQDLLEDLNHFRLTERCFFLIEGAERLGTGSETESQVLDTLRQWARRHSHCVLLVFRHHSGQRDPGTRLQQAADNLGGYARWIEENDSLGLEFLHWFGEAGCKAASGHRLELTPAGRLQVTAQDRDTVLPTLPPTADEQTIFAVRTALPVGLPAPGAWHICEDLDELKRAAHAAVAATLVLGYDRSTPLRGLQQTVLDLRRDRGPRLKIVIRENNARLRHNQESVLLRIGANLVIPAEIPASRWTSLVDMIQGQLYLRPLPRDLDTALADTATEHAQGYLAPPAFCSAVAAMQHHSRAMGIANALVVLPMARGLTPSDALRHCTIRRPGDICSADNEAFYLFLYACREVDVTTTLERLFNLPLGDLFDEEVRCVTPSTIQDAADELAQRADRLPDLSGLATGASVEPAALAKSEDTSDTALPTSQTIRPVLRPLLLRTGTSRS